MKEIYRKKNLMKKDQIIKLNLDSLKMKLLKKVKLKITLINPSNELIEL